MDNLTSRTFPHPDDWLEFATDAYLDVRHPNWCLAEEFGDVVFVAARGVVFVHRDRAEHIARELGGMRQRPVLALPARQVSPAVRHVRQSTVPDAVAVVAMPLPRWRAACAWLGMALGAAVFIAALAVPLDDPALVIALMLTLRSGRVVGTA